MNRTHRKYREVSSGISMLFKSQSLRDEADRLEFNAISYLREGGTSYADIGIFLGGMSSEGVRQRYLQLAKDLKETAKER